MIFNNSNEVQYTAITNCFYLRNFFQSSFQQADMNSNNNICIKNKTDAI